MVAYTELALGLGAAGNAAMSIAWCTGRVAGGVLAGGQDSRWLIGTLGEGG